MPSPVDIANLALSRLGQTRIVSFDQDDSRARVMKDVYPIAKDTLLRLHPWNFAQKRVALSRLTEAPAFGWSYQYQLPNDFLRLTRTQLLSTDFRVEGDKILANTSEMKIIYTHRLEDSEKFDMLFVDTLAYMIAADTAMEITASRELLQQMKVLYENSLTKAQFLDSRESADLQHEPSHFLEARLADVPFRAISDSSL
jgi:hypothetical protein